MDNTIFDGFENYISFISTIIGCIPGEVISWFLAIFTSILTYSLAKYLIDGL